MIHYGDITKLHGYDMPAVDVITGGSPCQDLSVAGRRAGFEGERSVLFLDQIRIIKEMRERDEQNGIQAVELRRPRFMVWENVPGAFSSRKGEDFRAVLEETIRVVEPQAPDVPVPKNGWPNAGLLYDDMGRWSVAWRVHDARFWGVPQRRRRIALVADFAGLSAGEVLFERESLCWHSAESEREKSFVARRDSDCTEAENSGGRYYDSHPDDSGVTGPLDTACTVSSRYGTGGNNTPPVVSDKVLNDQGGERMDILDNETTTLRAQSTHPPIVTEAYGIQGNIIDRKPQNGGNGTGYSDETVGTLNTIDRHATVYMLNRLDRGTRATENVSGALTASSADPSVVAYPENIGSETHASLTSSDLTKQYNNETNAKPEEHFVFQKTFSSSKDGFFTRASAELCDSLVATDYKDPPKIYEPKGMAYVARRITPMECERLQGYPDGWTDIGDWVDSKGRKRKCTDGMRYKALGNSIALPYWKVLARKIAAQYDRDITMGSLFDGIAGFPIAFMHTGATCLWTCEIDDFPRAVVKYHFGGEDAD